MKIIGLLGGMSWESSIEYERIINTEVRARLGGLHSAELIVRSYDFATIEALQTAGRWNEAGELLASDARHLERAGAQLLVLCTNTMHLVADQIKAAVTIPLVHLVDTTAAAVARDGLETVGLLGTRFTMEHPFYRDRLAEHGLRVVVPDEPDRAVVHDVIYDELVRGVISDPSREAFLTVIERLRGAGAEGVVAGCTEIELLIQPDDLDLPYYPTTTLHARAAVDRALA